MAAFWIKKKDVGAFGRFDASCHVLVVQVLCFPGPVSNLLELISYIDASLLPEKCVHSHFFGWYPVFNNFLCIFLNRFFKN
jgi:hypothetical protein